MIVARTNMGAGADPMLEDLRLACRLLGRRWAAATAIILTLGLGIGATVSIFRIVHGVLLRPLAYSEPAQLMRLYHSYDALRNSPNARLQAIWERLPVSWLNVVAAREDDAIDGIGLYQEVDVVFGEGPEPERVPGGRVDAALLAVLAQPALRGQTFDDVAVASEESIVLLGEGLWRRVLGADPSAVGRRVRIDGTSHTVVGIMPRSFHLPGRDDDQVWLPLRPDEDDHLIRDNFRYHAVARLASGVSHPKSQEGLDRVAANLATAYPDSNTGTGFRLVPLRDTIVEKSRPLLALLAIVSAVVLLMACVNVAHVLLVQVLRRDAEMTVRSALGATRGRLARQLLTESAVSAILAGALGLWLAHAVGRVALAFLPADLPRTGDIRTDGTVVVFTFGLSLLVSAACTWSALVLGLRRSTASVGVRSSVSRRRIHGMFLVTMVALALTLVVVAGLLAQSFQRLSTVAPGFAVTERVTLPVTLPTWRFPAAPERAAFGRSALESLGALPGISAVALTTKLPFPGPSLVTRYANRRRGSRRRPRLDARTQRLSRAGHARVLSHHGHRPRAGARLRCDGSARSRGRRDRQPRGRGSALAGWRCGRRAGVPGQCRSTDDGARRGRGDSARRLGKSSGAVAVCPVG